MASLFPAGARHWGHNRLGKGRGGSGSVGPGLWAPIRTLKLPRRVQGCWKGVVGAEVSPVGSRRLPGNHFERREHL